MPRKVTRPLTVVARTSPAEQLELAEPSHSAAQPAIEQPRSRPGRRPRASKYGTVADHPTLAAQFDVARNGRTPDQVPAGTGERLWWICPVADDHRWEAPGRRRLSGHGCPACDNKRVSVTNCLANYPHLAAQFEVAANGGRTPEQVIATTRERLNWGCPVARITVGAPRGASASAAPGPGRAARRAPASRCR